MKSVLVIGTGNFGTHLTRRLAALGNEIMIVDKDERPMEDLLPIVAGAKIGDCTDLKVLQSLDVPFRQILRSPASSRTWAPSR